MDPDVNLHEQMAIVDRLLHVHPNDDQEDGERLAELVEALVRWLARGGFQPNWVAAMAHYVNPGA